MIAVAASLPLVPELEAIDDVRCLPGGFPEPEQCLPFDKDEINQIAEEFASSAQKILAGDVEELKKLYYDDGFWRDQVSLSWTFRTFHQKA
jgi:hypothetical protein